MTSRWLSISQPTRKYQVRRKAQMLIGWLFPHNKCNWRWRKNNPGETPILAKAQKPQRFVMNGKLLRGKQIKSPRGISTDFNSSLGTTGFRINSRRLSQDNHDKKTVLSMRCALETKNYKSASIPCEMDISLVFETSPTWSFKSAPHFQIQRPPLCFWTKYHPCALREAGTWNSLSCGNTSIRACTFCALLSAVFLTLKLYVMRAVWDAWSSGSQRAWARKYQVQVSYLAC